MCIRDSLYGLERVGGLTGQRTLGGRDWYEEASSFLVRFQGPEGQWGTKSFGEVHPGTCFGVLVLKRATAPSSGLKPRNNPTYGDDDPARPLSLRIAGNAPLTAWVSSFGTKTLEKFEWDAERGQGPRVLRVEYLDVETGEVLATEVGDADQPAKAARFPVQLTMDRPGKFRLQARAIIRPIDDVDGEEVAIESQVLEVFIDAVMSQGMRDALDDLERNALSATRCTATASSSANDFLLPRSVVDGSLSYAWLTKPDDQEPWIEVEPDRPQRGDFVVLTPALAAPNHRTQWGRPAKVSLWVNDKLQGEFELNPDPYAKSYLPLKKLSLIHI